MNTSLKPTFAAAVMAALSFMPLMAHAGMFDDDEARKAIVDLRSKVDDKASKNAVLDLARQNEQLRDDVARLRGLVEVLTNDLANAQQRQKDFYSDLDTRLRKLEPQRVNVDGREVSVEQSEQKSFDNANALFKAGNYRGAAAGFVDFLKRYPQSGYAPQAQYLLGNAYYAQRDCRNAIAAQNGVVKNYPDSPKAPEALLNIAACQVELKEKVAAKRSLETLIAQYPDTPAAETAKERLATLK